MYNNCKYSIQGKLICKIKEHFHQQKKGKYGKYYTIRTESKDIMINLSDVNHCSENKVRNCMRFCDNLTNCEGFDCVFGDKCEYYNRPNSMGHNGAFRKVIPNKKFHFR